MDRIHAAVYHYVGSVSHRLTPISTRDAIFSIRQMLPDLAVSDAGLEDLIVTFAIGIHAAVEFDRKESCRHAA
jgi:hypothetical protein